MNQLSGTFHPKNPHQGRYDLDQLCKVNPALVQFVFENQYGSTTIDFSNPKAVLELNRALLTSTYDIDFWDLPEGFLCPPIPGRADYLHHLSDLLPKKTHHILDIGTGANCIYPLIGNKGFGWTFVASDVHPLAVKNAKYIVKKNQLDEQIDVRHQDNKQSIFKGVVKPGEHFSACVCNPPFHRSAAEALKGTQRKNKNLGQKEDRKRLNFGGQSNELWCEGGEVQFILNMITESELFKSQIDLFTSLVSQKAHVPILVKTLKIRKIEHAIHEMSQGNKVSRFLSWRFK